jgi:hypothetical protein
MGRKRQPVAAPAPAEEGSTHMSIKTTRAWLAWVKSYAASRRVGVSALVDIALAEAAKRDGFPEPPPRTP